MFLTGRIKTIVSTGNPDYIICSQATTALTLTNLNFKISISKDGGLVQNLVNTTNLAGISGLVFATYTYGNYDIRFTSFAIDTTTSTFQAEIDLFYTGTTDVVTWEKFNLILEVSSIGYQPFKNVFEFYNYDVGNALTISGITDTTGNQNFEIILVNNTNNLDAYSRQTKAASSFITLRRPFSDQLYCYNMIGTQGNISYSTTNGIIGSGNSCQILNGDDLFINQTVTLSNLNTCTTGLMTLKSIWSPILVSGFSSANTCNNCTNNIANTSITYYLDATSTTVYKINGTNYFLSEFMSQNIILQTLDYQSNIIDTDTDPITLTYTLWIADDTVFLNPTTYTFIPSVVGDNVINVINDYYYSTIDLINCVTSYLLPTCNWWTVEAQEACSDYLVTNCSTTKKLTVTVQLLDNTSTFNTISSTDVLSGANLSISFATDGVYMLKIAEIDNGDPTIVNTRYYTLPIYCSLQSCILDFVDKVLCKRITAVNCKEENHYNFNALLINAHSYFLLLNQELNNNYIYSTITTDKLASLYTLKTFIDRFAEYCEASESPCIDCK